jgi:hypothetical protein
MSLYLLGGILFVVSFNKLFEAASTLKFSQLALARYLSINKKLIDITKQYILLQSSVFLVLLFWGSWIQLWV